MEKEKDKNIKKTEAESTNNDEVSLEDKLKATEEKLLRALAETENQRRRSEKRDQRCF